MKTALLVAVILLCFACAAILIIAGKYVDAVMPSTGGLFGTWCLANAIRCQR